MNKSSTSSSTIAVNKKAHHDYTIEKEFEAGLVLEGWEVKSLRASRVQLVDSYVKIIRGEIFLVGGLITPLNTASTHKIIDPRRTRKCLLHQGEIDKLIGAVERKGYTLVPLKLYWKQARVKLSIGLAKGKKTHDKRAALKEKDWQRDKARLNKINQQ